MSCHLGVEFRQNHSQREIGRVTGIDRKTIRAYQRAGLLADSNPPGWPPGMIKFPHPGHRLARPPRAASRTVSLSRRSFG